MNKKLTSIFLCICICISMFVGCSQNNGSDKQTKESGDTAIQTAETDEELLATVINEIYRNIDITSLSDATDTALKELFFINPEYVESYAIRYTDFKYGVADVVIVKPNPSYKQDILDAFESRKQSRISECKNYDIHNSYQIAQKAEIYERGGYLIMLMLEDNESAKKVIEKYIV